MGATQKKSEKSTKKITITVDFPVGICYTIKVAIFCRVKGAWNSQLGGSTQKSIHAGSVPV